MREYEAIIANGEPKIQQQGNGITQYQDWKWGTSKDIKEAASKGSLCCRLYLRSIGENF